MTTPVAFAICRCIPAPPNVDQGNCWRLSSRLTLSHRDLPLSRGTLFLPFSGWEGREGLVPLSSSLDLLTQRGVVPSFGLLTLQLQSGNVVRFDTAGVVLGTAQHIRFELPAWCSTRILKHVHVAQKKNISDRNAISCYQNTILYDTVPVSTRVSVWGAVQEDPPNSQLGPRVLVGRSVVLCGYNDSERCGLLATITSCGQRDEVSFPVRLASHSAARSHMR